MILAREHRRELEEVQRRILGLIVAQTRSTGTQPSIREIADALEMTQTGVHYHLRTIAERGWCDLRGMARGVVLPLDVRDEYAEVVALEAPPELHAPIAPEVAVRR